MRRKWLCFVLAALFCAMTGPAEAGESKKKPPPVKIRWRPIDHSGFKVDGELGTYMSCAYKMFVPGKPGTFSFANKDEIKIELMKPGAGEVINIRIYANKKKKRVTREMVVDAIENAVEHCYSAEE